MQQLKQWLAVRIVIYKIQKNLIMELIGISDNIRMILQNSESEPGYDLLAAVKDLGAWVEERAKARELPEMDGGRTAQKIIVTSSAYPFIISEDGKARYQIQMRLEYYKEA